MFAGGDTQQRLLSQLLDCKSGLTIDEIAARLYLSPLTTKTHVSHIMTKLDARDRAQLVVIAYESGLVIPGGGGG